MPIVTADIDWHMSGGVGNTDPNLCLGGVRATQQYTDSADNNIFDDVSGAEASSGDTEYRGSYLRNAHGSLTWLEVHLWIESNTPGAGDQIAIALAGEGINATMETIADESTAPVGETFSEPANYAAGLDMNDIATVQHYGFWQRRVVAAGAAAVAANSYQLKAQGDTTA